MSPDKAQSWLTLLFRLNGLMLTSAVVPLFFPNSLMQSMHGWLGLGEMPQSPITEYLARSCCLMYAMHGVVLLAVSLNMQKLRDLVPVMIFLHLALGAIVLGIDIKAGMPWYWTAAEGPGIMLFACGLFWLWKQTKPANQAKR